MILESPPPNDSPPPPLSSVVLFKVSKYYTMNWIEKSTHPKVELGPLGSHPKNATGTFEDNISKRNSKVKMIIILIIHGNCP